jgi:hypothetical protein
MGVSARLLQVFEPRLSQVRALAHQLLNCCCTSGALFTEPFPAGSLALTDQLPGSAAVTVCLHEGSAQQLFETYVLCPLELVIPA